MTRDEKLAEQAKQAFYARYRADGWIIGGDIWGDALWRRPTLGVVISLMDDTMSVPIPGKPVNNPKLPYIVHIFTGPFPPEFEYEWQDAHTVGHVTLSGPYNDDMTNAEMYEFSELKGALAFVDAMAKHYRRAG